MRRKVSPKQCGTNWMTTIGLALGLLMMGSTAFGGDCVGDANNDGAVNVQDLTSVILDWGTDGSGNNGDVDGSGFVDVGDLTTIILNWGDCPPGKKYECNATKGSPANDCCTSPTVVSDGMTVPFDTTSALTDGPDDPDNTCNSAAGDTQNHFDLWYLYTAAASGTLNVSTCGQATDGKGEQLDTKIQAFDVPGGTVDCNTILGNIIACNEDCATGGEADVASRVAFKVVNGETYLIRLGTFSDDGTDEGAASGSGDISFNLIDVANDNCVNAIAITGPTTTFDTTGASHDGLEHEACELDDQIFHDIWFSYTAECDGVLSVSLCNATPDFDSEMALYDNNGPAPCPPTDTELLACNDSSAACGTSATLPPVAAKAGDQFLIRVGGSDEGEFGPGTLSVNCSSIPNDFCEFAAPVGPPGNPDGHPSTVTTSICSGSPSPGPECGNGPLTDATLWYRLIGDGTTITASLCGTPDPFWDSRLTVYCGDCETLFCDEQLFEPINGCGGFGQNEELTFCTVDGRAYTIAISVAFGCGDFTLDITSDDTECFTSTCDPPTGGCCTGGTCIEEVTEVDCNAMPGVWNEEIACADLVCPPNDFCEDAIDLGTGDVMVAYDNTQASSGEDGAPFVTCDKFGDTPGMLSDLWFIWTSDIDGMVQIDTCAGELDSKLAVYEDAGCPVENNSDIGCNDDDGNNEPPICGGTESAILLPTSVGQVLRIRVGGWGTDDGGQGPVGASTLSVTTIVAPEDGEE